MSMKPGATASPRASISAVRISDRCRASATIFPPAIARSPTTPGAPVPSKTVHPRMTSSYGTRWRTSSDGAAAKPTTAREAELTKRRRVMAISPDSIGVSAILWSSIMPRHVANLVAVLLCAVTVLAAQRRPDFSGTWQVDLDRSKGASPANANMIVVITQDAKTMTIAQKGLPTVVYNLDGTPAKNTHVGRGGDATFTSAWEGDKLVTTVTGGQEGQKETRFIDSTGQMVEISELKSALGPRFGRTLYWTKIK